MKPLPVTPSVYRGGALCPACIAALAAVAAERKGATLILDMADPQAIAAWEAARVCDHPKEAAAVAVAVVPPAPRLTREELAARLAARQAVCEACDDRINWEDPDRLKVLCERVPKSACARGCRSLVTGACAEWEKATQPGASTSG